MREEDDLSRPLRLCLAIAVVASHSALLATGSESGQPLAGTSLGNLGSVALNGFMCLSGYYIAGSILARGAGLRFARARIARLGPALWAHAAIGVLLAGALLSDAGVASHLASPSTWAAAAHAATGLWGNPALTGSDGILPGVFERNPIPRWNDPLWSIKAEIAAYAAFGALAAIGVDNAARRRILWLATGLPIAAVALAGTSADGQYDPLLRLLACFSIGASLRLAGYRGTAVHIPTIAALAVIGWALRDHGWTAPAHWLSTGMACILLSRIRSPVRWRHDLSYGTYIWAFPIGQAIVGALPGIGPGPLFAATLAATLPIAAASWAMVERPAMRLAKETP